MSIQFGTDPEFVILNADGQPVPAHKVFPDYTKEKKWESKPLIVGQAKAFRDGYNLEFNLTTGMSCRGNLLHALGEGLKEFRKLLPKGFKLATLPAYQVNLAELLDAPADVREFGCDPSFDAYTGKSQVAGIDAMTHPWRYAGGHLHFTSLSGTTYEKVEVEKKAFQTVFKKVIGPYDPPASYTRALDVPVLHDNSNYQMIIKLMDLYIGLPLALIFASEATFQRRQYYGKAGEFRPQVHPAGDYGNQIQMPFRASEFEKQEKPDPYTYSTQVPKFWIRGTSSYKGVEYRTPGPELFSHPAIAALAMGVGRWVIQNFAALEKKWDKSVEDELRNAINNGVGGERLLQKVAGYYDADVVKALRNKAFWNYSTPDGLIDAREQHYSWPEYPTLWGLTVPDRFDKCTYVEIPEVKAEAKAPAKEVTRPGITQAKKTLLTTLKNKKKAKVAG